jgi:hypothetical protein
VEKEQEEKVAVASMHHRRQLEEKSYRYVGGGGSMYKFDTTAFNEQLDPAHPMSPPQLQSVEEEKGRRTREERQRIMK